MNLVTALVKATDEPQGDAEAGFEVCVDGVQVMRGDKVSIEVVFANMSGLNFVPEAQRSSQTQTHAGYLESMEQTFGVKVGNGSVVSWGGVGCPHGNRCTVRLWEGSAMRVSQAERTLA